MSDQLLFQDFYSCSIGELDKPPAEPDKSPAEPPFDPALPTDALREISAELARIIAELDATLAECQAEQAADDAQEEQRRAVARDQIAAQDVKVAEMAARVDELVSLASGRCDQEDVLEQRVEDLELLLAQALDQQAAAFELLELADAAETAGLGGSDFASLVARSLEQRAEPCGASRAVAMSLDADTESDGVACALRDRAKQLLRPAAGSA
jgi:hypothetical protein